MAITLKAARVNAGLTQQEVAKAFGLTAQTIINWESGNRNLTATTFKKLCNLYNVSMDDIIMPCE